MSSFTWGTLAYYCFILHDKFFKRCWLSTKQNCQFCSQSTRLENLYTNDLLLCVYAIIDAIIEIYYADQFVQFY